MSFDIFFLLELLAVISGVASVWLAKKENVLLYPVGILSVVIWIFLCFNSDLYGQSLVNFFFFLMNIFGWYNWLRKTGDNSNMINIKSNSLKENVLSVVAIFILSPILYFCLEPFQDPNTNLLFVYLEMIITAINFVAMWLIAWKRIENWMLWIVADILCIPLFIYNEYFLSVIQFIFFIVIAFMGHYQWKKQLLKNT
ncbi:MAG: nicotinamide riboside transporter PnuC [Flavobacteriales bacterium]|nr:nicotinamide riboside transporter PnuC [Flavobacteriales bacterium]